MPEITRDPVCGMQVNVEQAQDRSEYLGKTYYLCSTTCKRQFDRTPWQFAE